MGHKKRPDPGANHSGGRVSSTKVVPAATSAARSARIWIAYVVALW